jgi:hypothetical protein
MHWPPRLAGTYELSLRASISYSAESNRVPQLRCFCCATPVAPGTVN